MAKEMFKKLLTKKNLTFIEHSQNDKNIRIIKLYLPSHYFNSLFIYKTKSPLKKIEQSFSNATYAVAMVTGGSVDHRVERFGSDVS